jgi:hypothetical protein
MAEKILSMRSLQMILEQFAADMEGAQGVRLDEGLNELNDQVPDERVKEMVAALKSLSTLAGQSCQQPVLAIKFRKA